MYCNHCGARQPADAAFCSSCGMRLNAAEPREETAGLPVSAQLAKRPIHEAAEPNKSEMTAVPVKRKGGFRHPMWIIPVLLLGIGAGGVYMLYERETDINEQASALHQEAGKLALDGKYDEALAKLRQAGKLRPEFAAAETDRALVETAQRVHQKLNTVASQLKQNKLEPAEKSLGVLEASLNKRPEPLFNREKAAAADNRDRLSVLLVKQELDKLNDVEALGYKLEEVDRLAAEEADEVHKLIVGKIVAISTKNAEALLQDKSFDEASRAVKTGLSYAKKDASLLALQDRIGSEQAAFEAAEQARIERAQQQAEADDLTNRTAAVDVSGLNIEVSDYGDITTTGTVTNVATRPIYGVEIHYSAYDASGGYLFSSSTYASPYDLAPGKSGTFTSYDYGWYDYVQIQVDNVTWYLE
ncbi:FxLYD domain-containing protein [Saccharibacillus alkalitolerans]|uniref:Zinc-ribbon domain-containing protein n=1 Tax=Saccharibacillus alkalitolerans TaxID=2705290 RepID=A0ABX0F594_9BACL|nr:FxLYD domain-containing protein [Saccharibacillus alkalitolerans]NGZ75090.1 hypothetical protein [Saccharibacillus alkalitolerans]